MSDFGDLSRDIHQLADPQKAATYGRFFKTAPGQYSAGDKFLVINVPTQHRLSKKYSDLSLVNLHNLLLGDFHEQRIIALMILKLQYVKASKGDKKTYFDFYLAHSGRINNWDLVDISAPAIVGDYLLDKNRSLLYQLARSQSLWERRIAIISTLAFIKREQFTDTLEISKLLLSDNQDLIHKAVGWMLREVGKRSPSSLTDFLDKYCLNLPRTTLRYSLEKFSPSLRTHYLKLR